MRIQPAKIPENMGEVAKLLVEYAESLNFGLCFQGFEEELSSLPGGYAPPRGQFLLARAGKAVAGGVGLTPLEDDICEMKRLYVRPAFHGRRIGRLLAESIIAEAREIGYRRMRLDTIERTMGAAIALYRSLGFIAIPAYYHNPDPRVIFFELEPRPAA